MSYTLRAIQELVGGEIEGNAEELISGINTLEQAQPGQLAFAEHERYGPQVRLTRASAIIVGLRFPHVTGKNMVRVGAPRVAFVKLMKLFVVPPSVSPGIHASAAISSEAILEPDVVIGEHAVIRRFARVGRGSIIESGVHVGTGTIIGEYCVLEPNVVLMDGVRLGNRVVIHGGSVIGGDGFGYVWADDRYMKIPQLGDVIIEDDVEIGSNVTVDRAMLGSTIIRRGTKIDNLVQIAHNDVIGEHVIMAGQVGLAGSVTVGDRVMFGGQSGVVDHITIGHDARVGAATPVTKDIKSGESVWGFPSRPLQRVKRELAGLAFVPRLLKHVTELSARIKTLEAKLQALEPRQRRQTPPRS